MKQYTVLFPLVLLLASQLGAATIDDAMQQYQSQGGSEFSAEAGRALWTQDFPSAKGGPDRSCTSCHDVNLAQSGKHIKTRKVIEPMATSVNPERFTDMKKIEKWFTRNCKWTLGRECTPQEKGDFLTFFNQ